MITRSRSLLAVKPKQLELIFCPIKKHAQVVAIGENSHVIQVLFVICTCAYGNFIYDLTSYHVMTKNGKESKLYW